LSVFVKCLTVLVLYLFTRMHIYYVPDLLKSLMIQPCEYANAVEYGDLLC
jgi:hypothetical protein